ncbi:MAG TPA: hypothetical protein VF832_09640 [Longimicrobiales bacterium]
MSQPASAAARTLRLVLLLLLALQLLACATVLLLLRRGWLLVLDIAGEHAVAYSWVTVTVVAAVAAYLLAIRSVARGERVSFRRAVAAAALADAAAFAGIFGFYLVRVWPMLAVAALAALLGLAIGLPLARNVADAPAAAGAPQAETETLDPAGTS